MAKLLKNELNETYVNALSEDVYTFVNQKSKDIFIQNLKENNFFEQELKNRILITARAFHHAIELPYEEQLEILDRFVEKYNGIQGFPFPEFIGEFGLQSPILSLNYIKKWTSFSTGEFAIRRFITTFPETVEIMKSWTQDKNEHVRRLSSEGLRPFLPWAQKLPQVIDEPRHNFEILELLKHDSSTYVRKSVANHWNDLSKYYPEELLLWAKDEKLNPSMVKHACRTLLKEQHPKALKLFGFSNGNHVNVDFNLSSENIKIPGDTNLKVIVKNNSDNKLKIRLEYVIYYLKKNNKRSPKKFFLKEIILSSKSKTELNKRIALKPLSTRTLHSGKQGIQIHFNGQKTEIKDFWISL